LFMIHATTNNNTTQETNITAAPATTPIPKDLR